MQKVILLTGATDGIGQVTAVELVKLGHRVLLHGRSQAKLVHLQQQLTTAYPEAKLHSYRADLSSLKQTKAMAELIAQEHQSIDVIINNAGVFTTSQKLTEHGLDVRFVVNTLAPLLLTRGLMPQLSASSRVVNLASAAQAPVVPSEVTANYRTQAEIEDGLAYAKSKLALILWSQALAAKVAPLVVAVNPKSLLASKMVKQAYGIAGSDLSEGADILVRAALSDEFKQANGLYFDNDLGQFAPPHNQAQRDGEDQQMLSFLDKELSRIVSLEK